MQWRLALCFAIGITAVTAVAQTTVQVIPANPTSNDNVILRMSPAAGFFGATVTQSGNHFRVDFTACPIICVPFTDIPLGVLPPGTYTFELFDSSGTSMATGSFSVAAVNAPSLSTIALFVLGGLLAVIGWIRAS